MEIKEYEKIKKEYQENEKETVEMNKMDKDFMKDKRYRTIIIYDGKWNKKFKETKKIMERKFGNRIYQIFFSIMNGEKYIAPHKNEERDRSKKERYHFGIIVSDKETGYLKVKTKKYYWKEKEEFKFDTKDIHSVYKPTRYKRVILIVDVNIYKK